MFQHSCFYRAWPPRPPDNRFWASGRCLTRPRQAGRPMLSTAQLRAVVSISSMMSLSVWVFRTSLSCSRSTSWAVMAHMRSQVITLSTTAAARHSFEAEALGCHRATGDSLNRCRRLRKRRPRRGRRRPTFARPATFLATQHPHCGTVPCPVVAFVGAHRTAFSLVYHHVRHRYLYEAS